MYTRLPANFAQSDLRRTARIEEEKIKYLYSAVLERDFSKKKCFYS